MLRLSSDVAFPPSYPPSELTRPGAGAAVSGLFARNRLLMSHRDGATRSVLPVRRARRPHRGEWSDAGGRRWRCTPATPPGRRAGLYRHSERAGPGRAPLRKTKRSSRGGRAYEKPSFTTPRPSCEHQGNGGFLSQSLPTSARANTPTSRTTSTLRTSPRRGALRGAHRRCVAERHSERTIDVACKVAEFCPAATRAAVGTTRKGTAAAERPYPWVSTPRARACLGGSYDRQGCEGRGHNSNVYFHQDWNPASAPRAPSSRAGPFRSLL